ncbi:MAG: hypothetical protein JXR34_09345 [Bacteroidales bacterium]|nr:hypothetical protein [Bacteroidales bacterium]
MKLKLLTFILALVVMASCSKDALDITFDANYPVDLNVLVGSSKADQGVFDVRDTIDLQSDAEVAKYLDRIKKWELTGLDGQFKNLSEQFTLINGVLKVSSGVNSAEWTFANINVTEAYALLLENAAGQFDQINSMLAAKGKVIISFVGTTDKQNINFNLGTNLKTKVTANPLD